MRMPVVLLSIFIFTFSSTALFSQSISYGRPSGFIRIEVQPNEEKLASTPFDYSAPSLSSQIFGLTGGISEDSGDQLKMWDAIHQAYVNAFLAEGTGDSEKDGRWLDADLKPSGIILVPGLGFFIRNNHGTVQSAYLAGRLPLEPSRKTTLHPSLNLFSYPFASAIPISNSGISLFGNTGESPDKIYLSISGPSYRLVEEDGIRKWVDLKGNASEFEMKLGNAVWYENSGVANVICQDESPYTNLFGKDDLPPSIAHMALGQSKDEIILTINCTQAPGEILEIFYKDLAESDVLSTGNGWLIAGQNIVPGGAAQIQWTDSGNLKPAFPYSLREKASRIYGRLFMISRQDMDSDKDGISNGREIFVYGTNPEKSDSDGDGISDYEEIVNLKSNPLEANSKVEAAAIQPSATKQLMPASNPLFAPGPVFPAEWHHQDIGITSPSLPGSASYDPDSKYPAGTVNPMFSVSASGSDIYGTADHFHYLYQDLYGDCEIIARVASQTNTNAWAKAGLMIRESLDSNSRNAFVFMTPGNGTPFQKRITAGATTTRTASTNIGRYFKLVKSGNVYSAYKSAEGTSWTAIVSNQTIAMGSVKVGFAVTSYVNTSLSAGTFDSVSITRSFTSKEAPVFTPASGFMRHGQKLEMNLDAVPGSEIWYTTDGSEPVKTKENSTSKRYEGPLAITHNCTVKAARFMTGYATSPVTESAFNMAGLMVKYYDLDCSMLPTPVTGQPYKVTMIPDINFPENKGGTILTSGRTDHVYAEITGQVNCPSQSSYTFYLISSDGSALYLDGTRFLNNDGKQGMSQVYNGKPLSPGKHDIKVVYFNTAGTTTGLGGLQLKWSYSGHSADFMTADEFISDDTDQDGLPDQWELIHGNLDSTGEEDADSDGWTNAEELNLYMTDPDNPESVPATASTPANTSTGGLVATYCKRNIRAWTQVPDLPNLPKYGASVVDGINFARGTAVFATSGMKLDVGAMFSGYIEVPTSGIYKFYLNCDDGANLYIDGKQVVCNDGLHTIRETYGIAGMEKGKHQIRVDYYQTTSYNGLIMQYEGPGIEKQPVPSSALSYSNQYLADMVAEDDPDSDGVHTIAASAGTNGSISPSGTVTVNYYGDNRSFTFTPYVNYHVSDIIIDGVSVGAAPSYQFTNIRRNHDIKVVFAIDTRTVTFVEGTGGTITGDKVQAIPFGGNCTQVTAVPNAGYSFVNWTGTAGFPTTVRNPLTVANVNSDMVITANFASDTQKITATAGPHGSITPHGDVYVRIGNSQIFTFSADAHYHMADVLVDGVSVGAVPSYEFTDVGADHSIHADFAIDTFTITASADANGTISPAGPVQAAYGSSQDFTITPSANFQISDVLVDNVSVGAVSHYQFTDIETTHTLSAVFVPVGTLPSAWHTANVASSGGSASYNSSVNPPVFTVTAPAVTDAYASSDKFYYLYQDLYGDCEVVVKIASQQNTNAWAKAGLMIRESLDANSRNAFVCLTPSNGTPFQKRTETGGTTTRTASAGAASWLKLVKNGDSYSAYKSSDGSNWKAITSNQTIEMGNAVKVGFAVASASGTSGGTADFTSFSITRTLTATPAIPSDPPGEYLQSDKDIEMDLGSVPGSEIWYTVGSSLADYENIPVKNDKTGFSKKYAASFKVSASCVVKARRFMAGYAPSPVSVKVFNKAGLMVKYYSERKNSPEVVIPWNALPSSEDFDSYMSPYKVSMIPNLDYPNTINNIMTSGRTDNVGAVVTGYLNFPVKGEYTFYISSGEGARMYLDDIPDPIINFPNLMEYTAAGIPSLAQKDMAAGFHRIRIEYFEGSGNGGIQLRWKHPLQTTAAVIPPESFFSPDENLDGIPEQWAEYKAAYLASHPDFIPSSSDDSDGDGTGDKDELNIFGTDPLDASDKPMTSPNPSDSAPRIAVSYCARNNRIWTHLPELGSLPSFVKPDAADPDPSLGLIRKINFPSGSTAFASSGLKTDVAARFKGFINMPADGVYKFYLSCDDGANLYIDGMKIIDNAGPHTMAEEYGSASLSEGMHELMIDYYQTTGSNGLILQYEGIGIKKQTVPEEMLFHSEAYVNNPVSGLIAMNDADSDGLTDAKENDPLFDPDDIFHPDDWDSMNKTNSVMDGDRVEPGQSTGPLTSEWKDRDIGVTGKDGSANLDSSVFTVRGAGSILPSSKNDDAFNFCYQELYGDCEVSARVIFQGNTNGLAKAGIMIRKSTDTKSQYAFVYLAPDNGINYLQRANDAGTSGANLAGGNASTPCWLKLVKKDKTYTPYMSLDGSNWTRIGKTDQTVDMGDTVLVGFAVTSMTTLLRCPAKFDNFSISRTLTAVPSFSSSEKGYYQGTRTFSMENPVPAVPETAIKFTVDGPDPDQNSQEYTGTPVPVSGNRLARGRLFKDGYNPGPVVYGCFTGNPPLLARYYKPGINETWKSLPDSSSRTPYKTTMLPDLDFPDSGGKILTSGWEDNVGLVVTGMIICPVAGSYTFYVTSGEGFALYLDSERIFQVLGPRNAKESNVPPQVLSAGPHEFRLEYYENTGTGAIQLRWTRPGKTDKELMTASDFFSLDTDHDMLADEWEKAAFPSTWDTRVHNGSEDTDMDGISDADELNLYLTDPLLPLDRPYSADPAAKPDDLAGGIVVSYTGENAPLQDFPDLPHYGTAVLPQKPDDTLFSYSYSQSTTTSGYFLTSGKYNKVGAYFKGYLNIPADGAYRFQIECDDFAAMEVDGRQIIDCSTAVHANADRLNNGFIPLKAGLHPFSISYYENTGAAKLFLRYEGPGFAGLKPVPASMFKYSRKYLAARAATDDDDVDGLDNKLEDKLGTKKDVADSDEDGLNDGDEYNRRLDPLKKTVFIYVDGINGLDKNTGLSAVKAKKTISVGLSCWKDDGKEYVVSIKSYSEDKNKVKTPIIYSGDLSNTGLAITKTNKLLKLRPWNEQMYSGNRVKLDCGGSSRAFTFENVDSSVEIEEFEFTNCHADNGGAIKLSNSSAGIIDCAFSDCEASGSGGAIFASGGSPLIDLCQFNDCRASSGGAVAAVSGSSMKISRSKIFSCQTNGAGGAVDVVQSSISLENCFIEGNWSVDGAISANSDSPLTATISCCTIAGNLSSTAGPGGATFGGSGAFSIVNTILCGNGDLQIGGTASPAVTYSDVEGGFPGEGNIDADPLFLIAKEEAESYHLSEDSPCIDAGTSVGAPAVDIDSYARPYWEGCDIGAEEYYSKLPGFSITQDKTEIMENGGSCQIKVKLRGRPKYQVIVDCIPDSGDAALDKYRLIFLPDNWRVPQTVKVYALQNSYVSNSSVGIVFSIFSPLSDVEFDGLENQTATIDIISDDIASIDLSATSITVAEKGGTGSFTAVLNTVPEDDVVLNLAIDNSSEGTIGAQTLVFTSLDWNIPQSVTVTGIDDEDYGDHTACVTVSVDPSSDPLFTGVDQKSVLVTFTDDTLDSDGDGMTDDWEKKYGLNPLVNDAQADSDGDGLSNLREFYLHTNPKLADTDGDGLSDGDEVNVHHTDPTRRDSDGDGVSDCDEISKGTDPNSLKDSDMDGLPDDWELKYFNNLSQNASDDSEAQPDGLCNMEEFILGTRPDQPTDIDRVDTLGLSASAE